MSFKVYINGGEWYQIRDWVLKHNAIETGGDLFGLWLDGQTAVVQFVLGPGKESRRTTVSFFQDVDYLREAGTYLTKHHGLCNVGQWHSHHRINLFKPSVGDENTVWNNMPNLGLDRYIVFIANITTINDVTINCFLFQIKNGQKLSVQHGKFKFLDGNSPLRLNEKVLQNVHSGAESFNELTTFEKEMWYIRNKDAKENLDINNENESGTGSHTGSRGQDVVSALTKQRKQKNSYSPNRTAGRSTSEYANTGSYIGSVQHRSQPIRPEGGFSQSIRTTTHSGQQQISALVKVKSSNISNVKNTAKLVTEDDQKRPINLPGAVSPNFDNEKQNQDKVYDGSKGYPHQGGGGKTSTTQTPSGTGQEFQSDTNQTILEARNTAINSAKPNYELNSRAKETVNIENANSFTSAFQNLPEPKTNDPHNKQDISNQPGQVDRKVSPNHQRNADQISHETTGVKSMSQTGRQTHAKVEYLGGHPITQQPSACRNSLYDNVEKPEQPATPMDTDEGGPITDTGQETRPETPSGIITSAANDNQDDKDDEVGWLCKQFRCMSLCGSSKK